VIHLPYTHPLYVDYCTYFNGNQDYFECHEVLEEYWKEVAPGDKDHVLVGLVQLATGMYHWRRGNFNGSARILTKSLHNLQQNRPSEFLLPIDGRLLEEQLAEAIEAVKQQKPFRSFKLSILNPALKETVTSKIAALPDENEEFLLHKHMLRDRSEVLIAREAKIAMKRSRE
jgi:uncharacterized protein